MKACVLHAVGDLRFEEVDTPKSKPGEVLLRIGACGVCGSDIPRVFDKGPYSFPTIPGHELAGMVVEIGPGVDRRWKDKPVAVFPLIPCNNCIYCEIGEYAQCLNYSYLGSRCDGGFAEYVSVPEWNLVELPEGLGLEQAAMVEPAAVSVHALRQAGVDIGDTVAVFGAGPIGLMLGMWAEAWGAGRVMLIDIDETRLSFANGLGFKHTCNAAQRDPIAWVMELTELGADLVIEGSGSSTAFEQCMRAARPFGSVVLMGNPPGEMKLSQEGYWAILRKQLTLHGTWNSTYSTLPRNEWHLALEFMASGRIQVDRLITHRVGLETLPATLVKVRDHTEFSNKVMLINDN